MAQAVPDTGTRSRTSAQRSSTSRRSSARRRRPLRRSRASDRSPARGVRPDPVARDQGIGAGERLAPLRERAGHRAQHAHGGTEEGGGALMVAVHPAARWPARMGAPTWARAPRSGGLVRRDGEADRDHGNHLQSLNLRSRSGRWCMSTSINHPRRCSPSSCKQSRTPRGPPDRRHARCGRSTCAASPRSGAAARRDRRGHASVQPHRPQARPRRFTPTSLARSGTPTPGAPSTSILSAPACRASWRSRTF